MTTSALAPHSARALPAISGRVKPGFEPVDDALAEPDRLVPGGPQGSGAARRPAPRAEEGMSGMNAHHAIV